MAQELKIPLTNKRVDRFLVLLIAIVSLFVIRPFLTGIIGITLLIDVFFTLILVSGAYTVSQKKTSFTIATVLLLPALVAHWITYIVSIPFTNFVILVFETLFFVYITITLLAYLFRAEEITGSVITAAVCAYFLIGLVWSLIYSILESVQPGSFQISEIEGAILSDLTYFSFVTLTTLGYGDITPSSPPARSLALLEAAMGLLYVAILIARLVGIHISQSMEKKTKKNNP